MLTVALATKTVLAKTAAELLDGIKTHTAHAQAGRCLMQRGFHYIELV